MPKLKNSQNDVSNLLKDTTNELLKDPEAVALYLKEVLAEDDFELLQIALRNITEARLNQETVSNAHYSYRIFWSDDDGEFVALCTEFSSLSYLDKTPQTALAGLIDTINGVLKDKIENRENTETQVFESSGNVFADLGLPDSDEKLLKARRSLQSNLLESIKPGEILLEEFLQPNGISQEQLSRDIDVSKSCISGIINRGRSITADTALRLSTYFGTTAEFWMNLQVEYDLRQAKQTTWPEIEPRIRLYVT